MLSELQDEPPPPAFIDIADADKKPCAGEGSNGHRIQMLPIDTEVHEAHKLLDDLAQG